MTDGLVDVATGRPLFEVGEGMLERLEDAKTALRLIEGTMGLPPCFPARAENLCDFDGGTD